MEEVPAGPADLPVLALASMSTSKRGVREFILNPTTFCNVQRIHPTLVNTLDSRILWINQSFASSADSIV